MTGQKMQPESLKELETDGALSKGIKLNMMTVICIGITFILLFVLHSIKSIYVINYPLFWAYVALMIAVVLVSVYFFQRYSFKGCIPVIITCSLIVGLMPYETMVPVTYDLLTQSNIELSGFSKALPRPIGVTIDILFYILPTTFIFFLLALGVRHLGSSGS